MQLVTIAEAMTDLGISRAEVYRMLRRNDLVPFKRPGDRKSYVDLDVLRPIRQDFQPRPKPARRPKA